MSDYVPVFKPGEDLTMTAGGTIAGGQLVYVSAANTVLITAGANAAWLGVATTDATVGQRTVVTSGGVQELTASGAIAAGDVLISAAAGKVAAIGGGTTYSQVVGIAVTAAADAAKVRVRMIR